MNCYICSRADQHFKEAQAFTVGGTTAYPCPHPIEAAGAAKPLPDL